MKVNEIINKIRENMKEAENALLAAQKSQFKAIGKLDENIKKSQKLLDQFVTN